MLALIAENKTIVANCSHSLKSCPTSRSKTTVRSENVAKLNHIKLVYLNKSIDLKAAQAKSVSKGSCSFYLRLCIIKSTSS